MTKNKGFMVVTRTLMPPEKESIQHVIYVGSLIRIIRDIANLPLVSSETARNYLYGVYKIEVVNGKLFVHEEILDYNDILNNGRIYGKGYFGGRISLPLNSQIKAKLEELLGELS